MDEGEEAVVLELARLGKTDAFIADELGMGPDKVSASNSSPAWQPSTPNRTIPKPSTSTPTTPSPASPTPSNRTQTTRRPGKATAHLPPIRARKATPMTEPEPRKIPEPLLRGIADARHEHTPRAADRPALAGRYVLPDRLQGIAVWREHGLLDEVTTNGRRYYVLSPKAATLRNR